MCKRKTLTLILVFLKRLHKKLKRGNLSSSKKYYILFRNETKMPKELFWVSVFKYLRIYFVIHF